MKKSIALALVLMMLFSLSACAQMDNLQKVELPPLPEVTEEPAAEPTPTPEATEEPTVEEPEPLPEEPEAEALSNRVIVNFKQTSLENYDPENGEQLILSFSYVTPVVYIEGRDEAAEAINEFIATLDETYYTGNDYGDGPSDGYYGLLEQAEDNYTYVRESGNELPIEYSANRSANVERADQHVFSFTLTNYEYTGGAHGFYVERAYVFDTETGKRVALGDLTEDSEALKTFLLDRMLQIVESDEEIKQAVESYLTEGETLSTALEPLLRSGSWYLGNEGMVIFSDLYEIAPYAAGIQSFVIPYADLEGHIDARWLPVTSEEAGEWNVLPMEDVEEGSVEIVDRLEVNADGEEICLYADGTLCDLSILDVGYTEGSGFYPNRQLWACSYLQDCAVQIAAVIPEGMPNLMIRYRSADGEEQNVLLSQSGLDGSYQLIPDDIEAVG